MTTQDDLLSFPLRSSSLTAYCLPMETWMFPLRDRTRRWICRTIFLTVGVAPMLSIIGWCMAMASPSHVAGVRAQFASTLGVELRFEKLSHPGPGTTLL